jgi:hypothetical protein
VVAVTAVSAPELSVEVVTAALVEVEGHRALVEVVVQTPMTAVHIKPEAELVVVVLRLQEIPL